MIAKIISFIHSSQLINPNETIIAAVSGGVDSMVLLYCLNALKEDLQFELKVLHVNHGVRGEESDSDESLVKEVAGKLSLPLYSETLTGFNLNSSEDDLRNARYTVFNKILQRHPGAKIATAHTLDDQLETFLMRLAKGSKLNGLCSIPAKRDNFIRPLLGLKKSELIDYAATQGIPFREDRTNRDSVKTRNKIRNCIIPDLLDVFGDEFYAGFQASHTDLCRVNHYIREQTDKILSGISKRTTGGLLLNIDDYMSRTTKIRHLILESCVSEHYPLNFGIPSGYFHAFESFVKTAVNGAFFEFRNGLRVFKFRNELLFTTGVETIAWKLELYPGAVVCIGNYEIQADEIEKNQRTFRQDGKTEYICGDKIKWPLTVRNWESGDWFYPLGSDHRQKLSDFFINQKIEINQKSQIPIIATPSDIVWIAGLRIDNRYRITEVCKKIVKLELRLKSESCSNDI